MILVTGGAYSGKTDFAVNRLGIAAEDIADGKSCGSETAFSACCVKNFHLLIRRLLADGEDTDAFTKRVCYENPDAVMLLDETGCGIIPLDRSERVWREAVGRSGCILAANSERVVRMVCGIPTAIKGEL